MLWLLIIGIIAGCLVGNVMKDGEFGIVGDMVVGVAGSFIGGYIFGFLGVIDYETIGELIMASVGAIVLLFIIRLFQSIPHESHFSEMRRDVVDAELRIYDRVKYEEKND